MHLDARRLELPHQLMVVCRDHDRGSEPVQFDEQAQKATRHLRVDVAGRLVREQHFWLADDGARDGCPLLLPTRQHRRINIHSIAKTNPLQKVGNVLPVITGLFADDL